MHPGVVCAPQPLLCGDRQWVCVPPCVWCMPARSREDALGTADVRGMMGGSLHARSRAGLGLCVRPVPALQAGPRDTALLWGSAVPGTLLGAGFAEGERAELQQSVFSTGRVPPCLSFPQVGIGWLCWAGRLSACAGCITMHQIIPNHTPLWQTASWFLPLPEPQSFPGERRESRGQAASLAFTVETAAEKGPRKDQQCCSGWIQAWGCFSLVFPQ